MITDTECWERFPEHRIWFNKLWLSQQLGYLCGPGGVAPAISDVYVVRPIYNLVGMGVGARFQQINAGDLKAVEPGYFWCERFHGIQHSCDFKWINNRWKCISSWKGKLERGSLSRFVSWESSDFFPWLPSLFDELQNVGKINVEFIGNKPIEVHLRTSSDPQDCTRIVPVWADDDPTLTKHDNFVSSYDDADGYLSIPRLGFLVQ